VSGSAATERIRGYDVARSLAILGMVVVHFSLVMAADPKSPRALAIVLEWLDGRAAATFMMLAGVGMTLLARKAIASDDKHRLATLQRTLMLRGIALFALGCVNLTVWTGDILRVYGLTFLIAPWFLQASTRTLLVIAAAFGLGFLGSFVVFDFDTNWDWETMTYHHLWTPEGWFRNLFYDGFRSVFPWSGLIFAGMALGRVDLREPATNRAILLGAMSALVLTEVVSGVAVNLAERSGWDPEMAKACFGTESMPALPLFLSAAVSTAVVVITAAVRWGESRGLGPIADAGRLALTWYLAHIVLGLGTVLALEQESRHMLGTAMLTGLAFYAAAVIASTLWLRGFHNGPLESLLRAVCG
jgi:uncharacterized protein